MILLFYNAAGSASQKEWTGTIKNQENKALLAMEVEAQVTCSGCLLFDTLSRWMVTGRSWVDLYSILLLIG